jgi:hypothetical protein
MSERPDGVDMGAPGTGAENRREASDVFLLRRHGRSEVFTSYEAA